LTFRQHRRDLAAVFASMLQFNDSHAHLADPACEYYRDAVIERARASGAVSIVSIGESIAAADRAELIARAHPGFIHHTAGVHPHDAAQFDAVRDIDAIREHVARGAVAVGECGLDYHYDHSPREAQRAAFDAQLRLAGELGRPVVVHTREADEDVSAMVENAISGGVGGVLHCYTGTHAIAELALAGGWFVSFSGIVTFKKWDDTALLRLVPEDRLLVESDSPYLAPVPFRGKRNEPSFVISTIERLATARDATPDHIAAITTANARRFFGLAMADVRS
jgi:TatD DNase family protein